MSNPILVGITGGIGSGKSTVCQIFEVLGIKVYYADDQAKSLMEKDETLINEIKSLFGQEAYQDGRLNRKFIADKVFGNEELLSRLNHVVHPAVGRDFKAWIASNVKENLVMKEAALLFETGSYKELDHTILVTAPEHIRIERVLSRDHHRTEKNIREIIQKQLPDAEKVKLTDLIIDNGGDRSLIEQAMGLYHRLT